MSSTDDIGNAGEGIGNAFSDAAASTKKSKTNIRKLKASFNDFKKVVATTSSTVLDSRQEFAKYSKVVDATNQAVARAAKNYKSGGTQSAIIIFSNAISGVLKAFLEYNDSQLAIYDRLSKFGVGATFGADRIQSLMDQTSFWNGRYDGFMNSVDKLGTGLLLLGKSTGEGTEKLANVLNVTDFEDTYIRLGFSIESLASAQIDYIKLQEISGIKVSQDSNVLRKESLEYAASLKFLSAITGQQVDKLAEEMATQSLDFKFQLKIANVDKETRFKLQKTATIASTMFGPEVGASVRDFLANGFASMRKSEGLLIVTKGQIADWVDQLENGTLTELEFNKNIGRALKEFEKDQRGNLRLSDSYIQDTIGSNIAIAGAYQIVEAQTDEQLLALMKTQEEKEKQDGSLKGLQLAQIKAERKAGKLYGGVLKAVSGPLTAAFTSLMGIVKEAALLSAKLGNYILGEQTEAFENVIKLLGTPSEIKGLETQIDSSIAKINESIKTQVAIGRTTKAAKQRAEQAEAKQAELRKKIEKGESVSQSVINAVNDEAMIATAIYAQAKAEEKTQYGETTEELEFKKRQLERRKAGIAPAAAKREEERAATTGAISQDRVDKVIKFSGGVTGDFAHFSKVNPALAEKIVKLAEEYYRLTGNKLSLTSGYRSAEEQTDMYNAWVAAGGNNTTKKTVHTEKYGNLRMPGQTSRHSGGNAVDIDADQLDRLGDQIINRFGLKRPFPVDDPVHLEGAKNGGIFDGPSSGYPMLFHGTEAIVPLLDNKTMAINLKNADADTAFDSIRSSMAKIQEENQTGSAAVRRQSSKAVATGLIDQIDTLISQVSQSNSIYHDIKLYMST